MPHSPSSTSTAKLKKINNYYRWHTPIYDATRWLFLFGRKRLIRQLDALTETEAPNVAEIGSGTGYMLEHFRSRKPHSRLFALDPSDAMIAECEKKFERDDNVQFLNSTFDECSDELPSLDIVIFSYSLTMMPDAQTIQRNLDLACKKLRPDGLIGIVDFHQTPFQWFRKWMQLNHVQLNKYSFESHSFSPPVETAYLSHHNAYLGWWDYQVYIGRSV